MYKLLFLIYIFFLISCANDTKCEKMQEKYTNPMEIPYDGLCNTVSLYPIKQGKYWGYINQLGQIMIRPQYDSVWGFQNNRAVVFKENQAAFNYIKPDGSFLFKNFINGQCTGYTDNWAFFYNKNEGHLMAIDTNGIAFVDTIIANISSISCGFGPYFGESGSIIKYSINGNDVEHTLYTDKIRKDTQYVGIRPLFFEKEEKRYTAYIGENKDTLFIKRGRGTAFRNRCAYIEVDTFVENRWRKYSYYINTKGRKIKDRAEDAGSKYYENGYYFLGEKGGQHGLLNKYSDTLLLRTYRSLYPSPDNETFIVVDLEGKNALFSAATRQWLTEWSDEKMEFYEGGQHNYLIESHENGKQIYLDKNGCVVWKEK